MRRHIFQGLARAALLGDESDLANFLTYGFAELDFKVRPSRQDLVLALFKVLMEVLQRQRCRSWSPSISSKTCCWPAAADDGQRTAEAFFAGIVKAMHQIDGICFLVFAERGLWNRFVPSLDGYIQDRLNNPVHVPGHGTIKALRLEAPPADLVHKVVEARLQPVLAELSDKAAVDARSFRSRRAGDAGRPHRADPARHAPAVPPAVRPPRLRRSAEDGVRSGRDAGGADAPVRRNAECRRWRSRCP